MSAPEAVVFDLDGTLVDSHRDIGNALNEVLTGLGVAPHPLEHVKTMIGGGVGLLLRRALADREPERFDEARERFYGVYKARLLDTTALYAGVRELLEALERAQVPCAIATNKPAAFTRPILEALALAHLPAASADEVAEKKPDPGVIRLALERAGLAHVVPERVTYVGDMPVDLETTRRFGGRFLGVTWGFDPSGLRGAPGVILAEDPGALTGRLLGHRARGDVGQT